MDIQQKLSIFSKVSQQLGYFAKLSEKLRRGFLIVVEKQAKIKHIFNFSNGFFETFLENCHASARVLPDPLRGLNIFNNFAIFSKFYIIYLKKLLNFQNSSVLSGTAHLRTPYKSAALQVTMQTKEHKFSGPPHFSS